MLLLLQAWLVCTAVAAVLLTTVITGQQVRRALSRASRRGTSGQREGALPPRRSSELSLG